MIWFHEFVLMHRQTVKDFEPVWVHGGKLPKRTLINCSCGKAWVKRGKQAR